MAVCVVTTVRRVGNAESLCTATFKLTGKGTLTAEAINKGAVTSGAITGGTGSYAGAHGSFLSKESKNGAKGTTVTLLE